uniref:Uncharacterized protein n=1 Tax=Pithovirus LCPAC401 TaxID=2506595 RepID=A0A481Z9X7_9VIRU|nr:MAG: hypothetical protein LCPAC401_03610 [Pithovirus LCPAC401]
MKCQKCVQEGLTSKVNSQGGGSTTFMGINYFYDEDGRYHYHDPNITTQLYYCDKQHSWKQTSSMECPVKDCKWNIRVNNCIQS